MPVQVFFIYASLVTLVYLATDGFQNNAPFVFTLPVVVLGIITLGTRMTRKTRMLTASSFFMLCQILQFLFKYVFINNGFVAVALYSWSMYPKKLELSALLMCVGHASYLFSFYNALRRWWASLAVATSISALLFLYGVFADLYRSLPLLVTICAFTFCFSAFSLVAAGSVWRHGSTIAYEQSSALVRFSGTFFLLICNSALLINHFYRHTSAVVWYLNFTYYISQFLLYFANERAY